MYAIKTLGLNAYMDGKEILEILANHKDIHDDILAKSPQARSGLRTRLLAAGYPAKYVKLILPRSNMVGSGRAAFTGPAEYKALGGPAYRALVAKLGELPTDAKNITPELASSMADTLIGNYDKQNSQVQALAKLRKVLKTIGVKPGDAVYNATKRPDLTTASNTISQATRRARAQENVIIPEGYKYAQEIEHRVDNYLAQGTLKPTTQMAKDFLVSFNARPGELVTLRLTKNGKVAGMLKKADADSTGELISLLPRDKAEKFLKRWSALPKSIKEEARTELAASLKNTGMSSKDFRPIGATLSKRRGFITGRVKNDSTGRELFQKSLRHVVHESKAPSVDSYDHLVLPYSVETAMLTDLTPKQAGPILELIRKTYALALSKKQPKRAAKSKQRRAAYRGRGSDSNTSSSDESSDSD